MEARATAYVPYEQYAADEALSEVRHEWVDGQVFAMAGGTEEHAFLGGAALRELGAALRGRPCRPLSNDMRLRSPVTGEAHYADAIVVCGPRIPHPDDKLTCTNPTVIVEVLTPSTEAYDRGEKFDDYQTLDSLADYVLISTGRNHVDHYARNADGSWTLRSCGPGQTFTLTGCDATIAVDAIYEGVDAVREAVTAVGERASPGEPGGADRVPRSSAGPG